MLKRLTFRLRGIPLGDLHLIVLEREVEEYVEMLGDLGHNVRVEDAPEGSVHHSDCGVR